jgi:uncharacterized protein
LGAQLFAVKITFDPRKRAKTLRERGLDFADAAEVFAGETASEEDRRWDYGERRFRTVGLLAGRMVMIVWTPRGDGRRIISMRYCHAAEKRRWRAAFS